MPFINEAVMEASRVFARAVEYQARQAVSTTAASVFSSATITATPIISPSATSSSSSPSSTDLANGSPGSSNGNNNNNNNNNSSSSQSSPLLFFVALGFGVVFTNLWIIVGVKYCFRYNARSRQMRMTEDGEPINLENMPRPHRRRREKKLMTMDEVNEKFPMLKYKSWVAARAQEGLPTRGGVSVPPSRANSVRDVEGVITELAPKERDSTEERPATSATTNAPQEKNGPRHEAKESTSSNVVGIVELSTDTQRPLTARGREELPRVVSHASHDDDDDEHINAALPPECLGTSGDTCAICIDTLEDDDDVRGLTCGHAFHAVCLDPWLTSRRACCPLCKADYYVPKPRPPAADAGDATAVMTVTLTDARNNRMNLPARPSTTWMGIRGRGRMIFPARFVPNNQEAAAEQQGADASGGRRFGLFNRPGGQSTTAGSGAVRRPSPGTRLANLRSAIPRFGRQNNQSHPPPESEPPVASGANNDVSPSQLEAGIRQDDTR